MTAEWRLALGVSVGVHAAALVGVPATERAVFDVERAPTSLELYIVAPPAPRAVTQPVLEPQAQPAPQPLPEPPRERAVVSSEQRGAQTEQLPTYLRNPAPVYPEHARRLGQEGRVLLRIEVLPTGRPGAIAVADSSGHELLDRAAVSAVRAWVFRPARRWGHPVPFQAEIPITFQLVEPEGP